MIGLAAVPSTTHTATRNATGAASRTRKRGVVLAVTVQNSRMPARVNATTPAKPLTSTTVVSVHAAVPRPAAGAAAIAVESNANLAMNPGSGGRPVTSSTQLTNMRPKNAMARGIATPASSSVAYGSGSRTPNAV